MRCIEIMGLSFVLGITLQHSVRASGDIDTSFGGDGIVTTADLDPGHHHLHSADGAVTGRPEVVARVTAHDDK